MQKKRVRLKQEECEFLGKRHSLGSDKLNARHYLDKDELKRLEDFRNNGENTETNDLENETATNQYGDQEHSTTAEVKPSAWTGNRMLNLEEYCEKYNLGYDNIRSWKFVMYPVPYYNIAYNPITREEVENELTPEYIAEIIKGIAEQVELEPYEPISAERMLFDRVIYTDAHIGMDTNKDGNALYPTEWNEHELMKRCNEMVNRIISTKTGDTLIIDELGDLMDGWDGMTVRKGHSLPQNMDNKKAFQVALKFKVQMIRALMENYALIICNNICEDNHAGAFGFIVNEAFKELMKVMYPNTVIVNNMEQFINNYRMGGHTFVLTHGKDSKNLKFGFKPHLDPKQIEKIDQYLKQNRLYSDTRIEFSKGDSHQCLFDMASSDDFDYMNYPAFSPSSEWVQTNFKKGRSGFVIQHFNDQDDHKIIDPYFFKQ